MTRVRSLVPAVLLAALALLVVACGGGGSSPTASTAPAVTSAEEAAAAVAARNPLFGGLDRRDPDLIGQGSYWEAEAGAGDPPRSWTVTYRIGWGDCQAGCIDSHTWTYEVERDGTVTFVSEAGPPLPEEVVEQRLNAAAGTSVGGRVLAGPVCPVETPGDPSCAPRPVAGADLVIRGAGGTEVARLSTDATGLFRVGLQPGEYTLEAQPVEGLMGTPGALPFTVRDGVQAVLDVVYDTGIR